MKCRRMKSERTDICETDASTVLLEKDLFFCIMLSFYLSVHGGERSLQTLYMYLLISGLTSVKCSGRGLLALLDVQ